MAEKIVDIADARLGVVGAIASPENAENIIANAKTDAALDLNVGLREYTTSARAMREELIARGYSEESVSMMTPNDLLYALRVTPKAPEPDPEPAP